MKTMRRFIQVFMLLVLLAGCNAKQENVVRINLGAEPATLDPRKARDLQSMTLARMFFDGLTRINQEGVAEMAVAEKVDISGDGKIYTFTLRSAAWSNGDPVKAQDLSLPGRKF
jgi:oligopeptide transport system substrate-binding protein